MYKNKGTSLWNSVSGVTVNSGAPGQISKSSPPSPFPTLFSFRSLPSPYFFSPSLYNPSLLNSLPLPTLLYPFTFFPFLPSLFPTLSFPLSPSPPLITARRSGERYSSLSESWWSPAAKRIFVQFTAQNLQIYDTIRYDTMLF